MDMSYDVVIDLAGAPVDHLIAAARPGGRVMLVAWRDKVEYSFKLAETRGIIIRHNSNFDRSDVANVCRLAARKQVELGPLVRDVVPVSEAQKVYDTLRDEPRRLFGTVFKW
jgi:threonine dehydrogenase-like Zn-dependent dehydrogenase